jgi:hypothetical protein
MAEIVFAPTGRVEVMIEADPFEIVTGEPITVLPFWKVIVPVRVPVPVTLGAIVATSVTGAP